MSDIRIVRESTCIPEEGLACQAERARRAVDDCGAARRASRPPSARGSSSSASRSRAGVGSSITRCSTRERPVRYTWVADGGEVTSPPIDFDPGDGTRFTFPSTWASPASVGSSSPSW